MCHCSSVIDCIHMILEVSEIKDLDVVIDNKHELHSQTVL